MKKVTIWLVIGCLFLIPSCTNAGKPSEVVKTNTQLLPSPSPIELPSKIVSTPYLTSTILITLTPNPSFTDTFSTPQVTPTIPLTPYIKMSKVDYPFGLVWLECEVSFDQYHNWRVAEKCFGFPLSSWQDDDRARFSEKFLRNPFTLYDIRITIDGTLYQTENQPGGFYILYRNEEIYAQSISGFTTFTPNRSLQEVGGKVAWELANPEHPTIILDGQDIRQEHNLDAAYLPYNINDRLIYVAAKDSKYYVVYGEDQIGPEFHNISIAYCCGPAAYSIYRVQGQYWFWGERESRYYLIMISEEE